jgi:hypothetical protein
MVFDGLDRTGRDRKGPKSSRVYTDWYWPVPAPAYFKTGALNHSATLPTVESAAAQATQPGRGAASNTVAVVRASIVVTGLRSILAGPAFLAGPQDAVDNVPALSLKLR